MGVWVWHSNLLVGASFWELDPAGVGSQLCLFGERSCDGAWGGLVRLRAEK